MNDDQDLQVALTGAAESVEPGDRLVAIRQSTRRTTLRRRSWWVGGGAALVAASAVTVALVAGSSSPRRAADPATTPTSRPSPTPSADAPRTAYPVYYVGPGPDGPDAPEQTLYREQVQAAGPLEALMQAPADPDYRTLWPEGSLVTYEVTPASIDVTVTVGAPLGDPLALQQLAHSLHAVEKTLLPVRVDDKLDTRFGWLDVERAGDLDVLNHMSIDEPAEASTYVSGESFTATGRGNSFEATGSCSLLSSDGAVVVGPLIAQMDGYMEPRLFPWELSVDLDGVPPGTYTFTCRTDDPTGGADGRGADTDTRTVIVE